MVVINKGVPDDTGRQDLLEVVRWNEEIKVVMQVAREVDMAALNAMLLARRADGQVAGFIMVSTELRRFGSSLDQSMRSLGILLHHLVEQVATLRKRARMRRHFERTAVDAKAGVWLVDVLSRQDAIIGSAGDRFAVDKIGLHGRLGQALRLCDTGRVLSRNAAIEAVYAGSSSATLTEVSRNAGDAIDKVMATLNGLEAALA